MWPLPTAVESNMIQQKQSKSVVRGLKFCVSMCFSNSYSVLILQFTLYTN